MNIRSWLSRHPHPVKVKCDDGTVLMVGKTKSKWADLELAIANIEPATIQALDAQGAVLRMTHLEREDDDKPEAAPPVTVGMNENDRDVRIAELIARVSDASAARHENAYKLAFEKMAFLVELLVRRLTFTEGQLHRTMQAHAEAVAAGEQGSDDGDEMMGKMVQGMMMKAMLEQSNGKKSNGKKEDKDDA